MEFEKLVSPSLKDLFINHIEAMILSGELQVGQQLPPERQLAQSMGVSRAVVNSGIAELEHRGFLEVRPRVGTFVTDYRRAAEAAFAFQHELAMLSGNTLMPLIFRSFYSSVLVLWERFCVLNGISMLYETSRRLCGHIRSRDTAAAVAWIDYCTRETISGSRRIYY